MNTMLSRTLALGVLGVMSWSSFGAEPPADAATKKELARFAGTWLFASLEVEGKMLPPAAFKGSKLILEGSHFVAVEGGEKSQGSFKVDVSKSPKLLDVTFETGPAKGQTLLGIYELTDDTYKVCIGMPGKTRPTAFVSKPGTGHVLEVLHKETKPKEKKDD
jgi:uncharacterized protein (TIGR03067 family)